MSSTCRIAATSGPDLGNPGSLPLAWQQPRNCVRGTSRAETRRAGPRVAPEVIVRHPGARRRFHEGWGASLAAAGPDLAAASAPRAPGAEAARSRLGRRQRAAPRQSEWSAPPMGSQIVGDVVVGCLQHARPGGHELAPVGYRERGEPVVRSPTKAMARRPTATSRGSTCASSGPCSRPPARGTTAECVAKHKSASIVPGERSDRRSRPVLARSRALS